MLLKPNALVYFRRNDLFIGGKHLSAVKMKFSPAMTKNLEVLNYEAFVNACQSFFDLHDLKSKRVLVVLDQSIVFSKTIPIEDQDKEQVSSLINDFIAAMPFEQGQRACIQAREEKSLQLYATNADLYGVIQESLRLCNVRKLLAITPAAAYEIDYSSKPSEVIDQFLNEKEASRIYNFASVTPL